MPAPPRNLPDVRSMVFAFRYSLSEVPATPGFRPRVADDRVGHFFAAMDDFTTDAGHTPTVRYITRWHVEKGRLAEAIALLAEANEVDPFLRGLHREWADALRAAGRHAEALREYRMVLAVPPELDVEDDTPFDDEARAEVLALQAASLEALDRRPEALERAREALALDDDAELAREVLDRIQ